MLMVIHLVASPVVLGIAAVVAIGGALGGVLAYALRVLRHVWPFYPTPEPTSAEISKDQILTALAGDTESGLTILQAMLRDIGFVRESVAHPLAVTTTWVVGIVPGAIVSVVVYYLGVYQIFPVPGLPPHH